MTWRKKYYFWDKSRGSRIFNSYRIEKDSKISFQEKETYFRFPRRKHLFLPFDSLIPFLSYTPLLQKTAAAGLLVHQSGNNLLSAFDTIKYFEIATVKPDCWNYSSSATYLTNLVLGNLLVGLLLNWKVLRLGTRTLVHVVDEPLSHCRLHRQKCAEELSCSLSRINNNQLSEFKKMYFYKGFVLWVIGSLKAILDKSLF